MSESERWEDPLVQGMAMGWNLVSGMVVPGGEAGTLMAWLRSVDSVGGREPLKGLERGGAESWQ